MKSNTVIPIEIYKAEHFERDYPMLWNSISYYFKYLSEKERIKIACLATQICGSCKDSGSGCVCWNDD